MQGSEHEREAGPYRSRQPACLVVLDERYNVLSVEERLNVMLATSGWPACRDRLPELIERRVRLSVRSQQECGESAIEYVAPNLLLHAVELTGPAGACIVVSIEELRERNPIRTAGDRFDLTPREMQVLEMILDGFEGREIAGRLCIQLTTVNEYFKNLARKIGARNRSDMIARIFR